jgi:hypothetical protein
MAPIIKKDMINITFSGVEKSDALTSIKIGLIEETINASINKCKKIGNSIRYNL